MIIPPVAPIIAPSIPAICVVFPWLCPPILVAGAEIDATTTVLEEAQVVGDISNIAEEAIT